MQKINCLELLAFITPQGARVKPIDDKISHVHVH